MRASKGDLSTSAFAFFDCKQFLHYCSCHTTDQQLFTPKFGKGGTVVTRTISASILVGILFFSNPVALIGERQHDVIPISPWPAPLYWQPTRAESQAAAKPDAFRALSSDVTPLAATPVGSLVFVGMT